MRNKPTVDLKNAAAWHHALEKKVFSNPTLRALAVAKQDEIELAIKIRQARKRAKLTQQEVATRMETTRTVISRLESFCTESTHSPSIKTLLKYAQALGATVKIQFVFPKD